ncbi:MAG: bifunctional metallophosphatase/5'-nucleotidase [Pseudoflavonifractor sp.]|nr:bifunctional metallophosphatase/5'-nucleotidase [Alloprevotella sp.]MCM1117144.1 bifunctional metallophosphatase/5'-nucleotidase [Pseudoflavonifractor sp.]
MKQIVVALAAIATSLASVASFASGHHACCNNPDKIVILHTNDTHSQIDPDRDNLGGVARRKALIDSVRAVNPSMTLIDAGDAVQGTLFFTLFRGAVEDSLMNLLGYDIQILGNHEFDNGTEELARRWGRLNATKLTTNYDLRQVPGLDSIFSPFEIRRYGNKKVGFIALNLDPKGMIADANAQGVVYLDPVEAANATAWHLRHNERVDYVVAITHIGYSNPYLANDLDLARQSKGIDVIIGGHSHTSINPADPKAPAHLIPNVVGDTVLIAQNGKGGVTVGEITICPSSGKISSRLIPVDSRLDSHSDGSVEAVLAPFRYAVDSITAIPLAVAPAEFPHRSPEQINFVADIVEAEAELLGAGKIDLAFMNRGGIRCAMPKGTVSRGLIMQMLPFDNRIVVMKIKGSDLADAFDAMAMRGGDGVSRGVRAVYDPDTHKCTSVTIDGEPIDPSRTYTLATIDYLAGGGDYMEPLTRGSVILSDRRVMFDAVSDHLHAHPEIVPDTVARFVKK